MFENIRKRDGQIVEFDSSEITALRKAGKATGVHLPKKAKWLTKRVLPL